MGTATLWEIHDLEDAYARLGILEHGVGWDQQDRDECNEGEGA